MDVVGSWPAGMPAFGVGHDDGEGVSGIKRMRVRSRTKARVRMRAAEEAKAKK